MTGRSPGRTGVPGALARWLLHLGLVGHPTRIRWHAITGVALTVLLVVHTARRRSRLRRSKVR